MLAGPKLLRVLVLRSAVYEIGQTHPAMSVVVRKREEYLHESCDKVRLRLAASAELRQIPPGRRQFVCREESIRESLHNANFDDRHDDRTER